MIKSHKVTGKKILISLNFHLDPSKVPKVTKSQEKEHTQYCNSKKTDQKSKSYRQNNSICLEFSIKIIKNTKSH